MNMKRIKALSLIIALIMILATAAGCSAAPNKDGSAMDEGYDGLFPSGGLDGDNNLFADRWEDAADGDLNGELSDESASAESEFISTRLQPTSTFSADVDTASYTYFRKLTDQGYSLKQMRGVLNGTDLRTEEMINYFDYSYALPEKGEVFGVTTQMAKTPWTEDTYLLVLGLTTEQIREKGANNLVFLIDVSGSMRANDKLPLLKKAFSHLVDALDEKDTVSIVTYSGREEVVLSGCGGDRHEDIMKAVNSLTASGSTNGEAGLTKAYSLALDYFIEDGNNRIILASDGDLNVGISSEDELKSYISEKRTQGIFLSVLGFGTGNYKDSKMSALAQNGNGVYYYIDGEREAERVLGRDILSTLYTVAKDVKLQIEFDAEYVTKYRLIGYENRRLNNEDFEDDTKDAGEVGAGHSVTVCYEIVLSDSAKTCSADTPMATLRLRYMLPDAAESTLREHSVKKNALTDTPSDDVNFIMAVIETAMVINENGYYKTLSMSDVMNRLEGIDLSGDPYKTEFKTLVEKLTT